jgi:DoxX-like family
MKRIRTIAYWFFTLTVAWEMLAGSMWDLLQIEYVRSVFMHLGYPFYLLYIIGVWKLPCGVVWLLPRFPRLKEWAYAGAIFNYTGAAASHFLVGDGAKAWIWPLVFAFLTLASWALRPPERKLVPAGPAPPTTLVSWVVPSVLAVVLLVLALLTLPKGPAPF